MMYGCGGRKERGGNPGEVLQTLVTGLVRKMEKGLIHLAVSCTLQTGGLSVMALLLWYTLWCFDLAAGPHV